jgi:hypothetical protein
MGMSEEIGRRYPREISLDDGQVPPGPQFLRVRPGGQPQVQRVKLRLMEAADKAVILQFARALPQEDILFLHSDITDPTNADEWITNIAKGTTLTLLAAPGELAGYVSLHVNPLRWTRRVGEVAIQHRARGGSARRSARKSSRWPGFSSCARSPHRWWRTIKTRGLCSKGWASM